MVFWAIVVLVILTVWVAIALASGLILGCAIKRNKE